MSLNRSTLRNSFSEQWFLGSAANMLGHQLREIGADNDKFDNAEAGVPVS
jgi:hypothetical protein